MHLGGVFPFWMQMFLLVSYPTACSMGLCCRALPLQAEYQYHKLECKDHSFPIFQPLGLLTSTGCDNYSSRHCYSKGWQGFLCWAIFQTHFYFKLLMQITTILLSLFDRGKKIYKQSCEGLAKVFQIGTWKFKFCFDGQDFYKLLCSVLLGKYC